MQAISTDLYEAAAIDGAGRWAQFRHVTLPGLRPTILFTIVVSTIGAAQLFGEPLLYHNGLPDGGTQNQYQTLGLLMYQQGWTNDRLGLASATAWTMFLIIVVAVCVNVLLAPAPASGRDGAAASRAAAGHGGRWRPRGDRATSAGSGGVLKGSLGDLRRGRAGHARLGLPALLHDRDGVAHERRDGRRDAAAAARTASLFDNVKKALELAPLNQGLINSLIVAGCGHPRHGRALHAGRVRLRQAPLPRRQPAPGDLHRDDDGAAPDGRHPALHDDGAARPGRAPRRR